MALLVTKPLKTRSLAKGTCSVSFPGIIAMRGSHKVSLALHVRYKATAASQTASTYVPWIPMRIKISNGSFAYSLLFFCSEENMFDSSFVLKKLALDTSLLEETEHTNGEQVLKYPLLCLILL